MIRTKTHSKRTLYITLSLLVVVVAATLVIAILHHKSRTSNNDQPPAAKSETPADTNSKGNASKNDADKGSTPSTDYTPPSGNNGISMTPTTSNGKVVVSTQLVGYSDGTCKLTATNGVKTNSQTASIIYAPSFSTCAGFTVPIDDLGNGSWSLTLDVTSGGITNTKTATYEVR